MIVANTTDLLCDFRWQDCGGIQLLDDLCRQMTQKQRRSEVKKK